MKNKIPFKAIFSPSNRLSPFSVSGYGKIGNLRFWRGKFFIRNSFIFSCLCIVVYTQAYNQHISNELQYNDMVIGYFDSNPYSFTRLSGNLTAEIENQIPTSDTGKYILELESVTLDYAPLEAPYFQRSITVDLILKDTSEHRYGLNRLDTLHKSEISQSRKTAYRFLRGEDPRWTARLLWPGLGVGTGIATIVSLFYLRSRPR